jgi:hypothetical protein
MRPWNLGEDGRGLLMGDSRLATWGGDLPDHWTAAEMMGYAREDIVAWLFIEPTGRVTGNFAFGHEPHWESLAEALARLDDRLRLDPSGTFDFEDY